MVKIKTCRISVFLWTGLNINEPISSLIGPEKMNILENIFIIFSSTPLGRNSDFPDSPIEAFKLLYNKTTYISKSLILSPEN